MTVGFDRAKPGRERAGRRDWLGGGQEEEGGGRSNLIIMKSNLITMKRKVQLAFAWCRRSPAPWGKGVEVEDKGRGEESGGL
jgi:hypothetical protein